MVLPAGKGKTSFIDVRDIAEVAALSFLNDKHLNKAYDLTGSEAIDYFEVADIISKTIGRHIEYKPVSISQFRKHMRNEGIEDKFINVMIGIYSVARLGFAKKVTPETEQLVGHPPITFDQYAKDYKEVFIS